MIVSLPLVDGNQSSLKIVQPMLMLRSYTILFVEDNLDANHLLSVLLSEAGHSVISRFDGVTGLVAAREPELDVILCDIGLPGISGYDLVAQLRRDTTKTLPCLIAMTGYSKAEARSLAQEVGFDHYLVKPIEMTMLATIFSSIAPRGAGEGAQVPFPLLY